MRHECGHELCQSSLFICSILLHLAYFLSLDQTVDSVHVLLQNDLQFDLLITVINVLVGVELCM